METWSLFILKYSGAFVKRNYVRFSSLFFLLLSLSVRAIYVGFAKGNSGKFTFFSFQDCLKDKFVELYKLLREYGRSLYNSYKKSKLTRN